MATIRIEDLRKEGMKVGSVKYRAGQTVRVHRKITEGDKQRIQIFEGLIIEVKNQNSVSATITVRRIVGGIGVEQVFPVHSPIIEKIELVKEAKVRQGRLYFMRNLRGKAARLRERFFTEKDIAGMKTHEVTDEELEEAVVEEEKAVDDEEGVAEEVKAEEVKTEEALEEKKEGKA